MRFLALNLLLLAVASGAFFKLARTPQRFADKRLVAYGARP